MPDWSCAQLMGKQIDHMTCNVFNAFARCSRVTLACIADGSCTLTCHPANEARWFHDAGQYCNSQVWDQVPQIQCPVRLAVGSPSGNMDFLVTGAAAQVNRFPDAKLKRCATLDVECQAMGRCLRLVPASMI